MAASITPAQLARRRERYATDPEYRERQKANARAQVAKRDPVAESERKRVGRLADPQRLEKRRAEQQRVKVEVIEAYGGHCACCDAGYVPHLTLDHVNGGGSAERKQAGCGRAIYRRLRRELRAGLAPDPAYQVLCWNCNMAKHYLGACGCGGGE